MMSSQCPPGAACQAITTGSERNLAGALAQLHQQLSSPHCNANEMHIWLMLAGMLLQPSWH